MILVLALVALATPSGDLRAESAHPLGVTWLPVDGSDATRSKLAVHWQGDRGATVEVTHAAPDGSTRPLIRQRALDAGVNLLSVPLAADAGGQLRFAVQTLSGVTETTFDLAQLHGEGHFAWESAFFGPGLDGGASVGGGGGRAMIVWDDGNGSALYVGGGFVTAGPHRVNRIARWNGSHWSSLGGPLGTGIGMDGSGNPSVKALAVFNGELIVAGFFDNAGGVSVNNIARWNGSEWSALDAGLSGSIGVEALAVHDGALFAGGSFTQSGTTPVSRIARWNGTQWSSPGTGISGAEFNQTVQVYALAEFNGELIAGGNFLDAGGVAVNRIARWNGSAWNALGAGVSEAANPASTLPSVNALAVMDGALVVGGNFRQAGGFAAGAVARWNGSAWSALGSGMTGTGNVRVLSLAVNGSELVAGGSFAEADGATVSHVARWNGSQWSALSGPAGTGVTSAIEALVVYAGDVVATGIDFATAGGTVTNGIARWNGSAWSSLDGQPGTGVSGTIQAMTVHAGELVVAGNFARAGGETVHAVARWNGSMWRALDGPLAPGVSAPPGAGVSPSVSALTVYNGDLIAGGRFLDAGGIFVNHVARWDGTRWWPLGAPGAGVANSGGIASVNALAVHDGALILGGQFEQAGGVNARGIARWDGSTWSALGGGVTSTGLGGVDALGVHAGELYAGGSFSQMGGVATANIARWNGTAWSALGSGTNGGVLDLASYNGALIAVGNFTQAGGQTVNRVGSWNGSVWSGLAGPSGTGLNGQALAVAVYAGELFVGGRFAEAGGLPLNQVARWNGSTWLPLTGVGGPGVGGWSNPSVQAFAVFDVDGEGPQPARLAAGGQFNLTGGVANWNLGLYAPGPALRVLTATPANAQFGTVIVGWPSSSQSVMLSSVGSAPVSVLAIPDATAPFARVGGSCPAAPFELAPFATCTLEYSFVPTVHGGFSQGIIVAAATDGAPAAFTLVGQGLIEQRPPIIGVQPGGLDASVAEGQSISVPMTIANLGDQSLDWLVTETPPPGLPGFAANVRAMTVWDDGTGPAVYVAGETGGGFNSIARWNGSHWSRLGAGMNGIVDSLTVYDGSLIAGGNFTQAGGVTVNRIARWNGIEWTALGTGMPGTTATRVNAVTVFNGELIAGGSFSTAGGVSAAGVARWNGSQWLPLGDGLGTQVFALTVYNGALIAGGGFTTVGGQTFNRVARWDGSAWSALGAGVASSVLVLGVHDGALVAGGAFTQAGGQPANRIARWDGSQWSALGAGVNNQVASLAVVDGALIAGGVFTEAGGVPANRIARWNGSSWSTLGNGANNRVAALVAHGGGLIAGGNFTEAGSTAANRLAHWDGNDWAALGVAAFPGCAQADWISSVAPQSGSVAGNASQPAAIVLDSTGLAVGQHHTNLCLASNDPGKPVLVVPVALEVAAGGPLQISPPLLDFGPLPAGIVAGPAMFSVSNSGESSLTVTAVGAVDPPFQAQGGTCPLPPFELAPGASCLLGYRFAPTLVGAFERVVVVSSDAGDAQIRLRGTGIAVIPAQLVLLGGSGQSAVAGSAFAQPLVVQVRDAHNNPVAGIGIGFSAPEVGASAILSAASATTDANGIAMVTAVANSEVGSYSVQAAGGAGAPVHFQLGNVPGQADVAAHLVVNRRFIQAGRLLTYVATAHNTGPDAASSVAVSSGLASLLDVPATTWQCLGPATSGCSAGGHGNLADEGLDIPAGGSVSYVITAPVRVDADGTIISGMQVQAAMDPEPGNDSTSSISEIVLMRDGFEPYGDGAGTEALEDAGRMSVRDSLSFVWPGAGAGMLDVVLAATAAESPMAVRASDFRIERLGVAGRSWARLVVSAGAVEQAGEWLAVAEAEPIWLALVRPVHDDEPDAQLLLVTPAAQSALSIGARDASYSLQARAPVVVRIEVATPDDD